jgi:elongation factor 1-beta
MKALEESVRSIQMEGLVWGASKLVAVGYGVSKLQITLVVGAYKWDYTSIARLSSAAEDELVSLEDLQEKVAEFEDYVQSSDVAAMQSQLFFQSASALTNRPRLEL